MSTLIRSFFLHVFLSLSAAQSFGDGAGVVLSARRFLIFVMSTSRVAGGATAPTQLSTVRGKSRHMKSGILVICVHINVWGWIAGLGSRVRSRVSGFGSVEVQRFGVHAGEGKDKVS